ncbi:MAG: PAS domain S-box protein [bacterium]|nr:PAS domain S-box protein [bacterium]MDD5756040.1 PAS domain S-box protein [bacterium]
MEDMEKNKLAESLLRLQAEIKAIFQGFEDVFFKVDAAGVILDYRAGNEDLLYIPPTEFLGKKMQEVLPPDAGQIFDEALQQINKTQKKVPIQYWLSIAGEKHHFDARLMPFVDHQVIIMVRDTTAEISIEQSLKESQEYLSKVMNAVADPIFVKDRNHKWVLLNDAYCEFMGYKREDLIGKSDFDFFPKEQAEVFWARDEVVFNDVREDSNEEQFTDATGILHIILTKKTLYIDKQGEKFIVGIIRDITQQKVIEESLLESYRKLQRTLEGTANALATALEKRDPYTAGHEKRVAKLACAIAEEMGLSKDTVAGIKVTAFLHDIGKIVVPAEILSKPSRLNEFEYSIVKTHPEVGYEILKELEFPWPVAQVILQHHERLNGTGYPKGLNGESIIKEARIMAVADVTEAMCSHRPYRPSLGIQKALDELKQHAGTLYDPAVVDACITVFTKRDFKFD